MAAKQHTPFSDYIDTEIEQFRDAYLSGNPAGLLELLDYCAGKELPLPKWATHETCRALYLFFTETKEGKVGRHANSLTRYREQVADRIRLKAYLGVRQWQENPSRYDGLPSAMLSKWYAGEVAHGNQFKNWARQQVSSALLGTGFFCSANRLKRIVAKSHAEQKASWPEEVGSLGSKFADSPRPDFSAHGWKWERVLYQVEFTDVFPPAPEPPDHILEYIEKWSQNS